MWSGWCKLFTPQQRIHVNEHESSMYAGGDDTKYSAILINTWTNSEAKTKHMYNLTEVLRSAKGLYVMETNFF